MSKPDYYEVLGLSQDASQREIKRAYRKQAMENHPDQNPDDPKAEEKFKLASEAYEVLSDPEQKKVYDQFGHEGLEGAGRGGGGRGRGRGRGFTSLDEIFDQFGDIFGDVFEGGRRGGRGGGRRRGADLRYDMEVSFEEAVFGTSRTVEIPGRVECSTCDGEGASPGSSATQCSTCGGAGQVRHSQGFFTLTSSCPDCGGRGEVIDDPCEDCGGKGVVEETREVEVDIPGGVDDGTRLRLGGKGEAGTEGAGSGDLYVFLHVKDSDDFRREGDDLHVDAEISFVQAALGCEVDVPTLEDGTKEVTIPPGTQPGDEIPLRGEGVPHVRGSGRGRLVVHVDVTIPTELTEKQRELLAEFAEESDIDIKKGFFDKIKESFGG
jgi:molecular chaperone DnaJ